MTLTRLKQYLRISIPRCTSTISVRSARTLYNTKTLVLVTALGSENGNVVLENTTNSHLLKITNGLWDCGQEAQYPSCFFTTPVNNAKYAQREASTSPLRNAKRARTSVTYCKASRTGMRCRRSLSVGSLIQPSIGIALSMFNSQIPTKFSALGNIFTFMEYVAQRAVVQYHDLAQIWFHGAKVLDIRPIPEGTMLSVVARRKVLSLLLKPIDDGICVFLDRGRKDNKVIPFANFSQKIVAVWALMYVVKNRMLGPKSGSPITNGRM